MFYRIIADLLVITHLLFILFVLFGGLMVLKWRWVFPVHILAATWGALIEFLGWICPLTPLENKMRLLGGEAGYTGGFIENYLIPIIYPVDLTHNLQLIFGIIVVVLNILIYSLVVKRKRDGRGGN